MTLHYLRQSILALLLIGLIASVCQGLMAAPARQIPIVGADAITTPEGQKVIRLIPTPEAPTDDHYHAPLNNQQYVVQPGDTLLSIALETGVDVSMLPCAVSPDFQPSQPLVIGNLLDIPGPDVLCHHTAMGETLATVAAQYGVTSAMLSSHSWNALSTVPADHEFPAGRNIQIPLVALAGDHLPAPANAPLSPTTENDSSFLAWMLEQSIDTSPFLALAVGGPFADHNRLQGKTQNRAIIPASQPGAVPENWPYGSGDFTWPLSGWLTQGYRFDHRALDIAAPYGTIVTAADRGVVVRAGWNQQGYGLFVIIDHNIDYITLYAHLSEISVQEGDVIAPGDPIGKVGSTGNSTGPHLHFEIRDFGRLINPLELLVQ